MKQIGFAAVVAGLLISSVQSAESKGAHETNLRPPSETVPASSLGTHFCLENADNSGRATFWGLEKEKWTAAEEHDNSGGATSCDIGPIHVEPESTDCPHRQNSLLKTNYRIRITPGAASTKGPGFHVSIINPNPHPDPKKDNICGKPSPFTFDAHLEADQHSDNKFKWLESNDEVLCEDRPSVDDSGPSDNSKYMIYVYFVDDSNRRSDETPASMDKRYRIEFFNMRADACRKNAGIDAPMAVGKACSIPKNKRPKQEPVGDGRQHRAQNYTCDYVSPLPGM